MRVCIVGASNIRLMPYLHHFRKVLDDCKLEYEVLYWNRFELDEKMQGARCLSWPEQNSTLRRLFGYWLFRRFLRKEIAAGRYDAFIVLGTQVGVLLGRLIRNKRYLLDIRDFSHENLPMYKWAISKVIQRAHIVSVSSQGFADWLPPGIRYVMSHNVSSDSFQIRSTAFNRSTRVISYIGIIGYYDANREAATWLAEDPGLRIRFVGEGPARVRLQEYCEHRGLKNTEFLGPFAPSEKPRWYEETNFVLACYGNDSPVVRTALPNKLYESCLYRRPLVVSQGTYLAKVVMESGIGLVFDPRNGSAIRAQLERYYDPSYYKSYCMNCERFLAKVQVEVDEFQKAVASAIRST